MPDSHLTFVIFFMSYKFSGIGEHGLQHINKQYTIYKHFVTRQDKFVHPPCHFYMFNHINLTVSNLYTSNINVYIAQVMY